MSEREACDWPRECHVVMMAQYQDLLGISQLTAFV